MKRRLRHAAAGLSAALWVALLVAWPWSYFEPVDFASLPVTGLVARDVGLVVCEGRAMVYYGSGRWPTPTFTGVYHNGEIPFDLNLYRTSVQKAEVDWNAGPFAYWRTVEMTTRYHRVFFPMWLPPVVFSVLPALWLRRQHNERQARRRLSDGACPACGYDLSGNAGLSNIHSARCPECGRNPLEAYDAGI